jgi:hypothetical protein
MKPGNLVFIGGGGYIKDDDSEDGFRASTANGYGIYLGEEEVTFLGLTKSMGKYLVLADWQRRKPFIWYWFSATTYPGDEKIRIHIMRHLYKLGELTEETYTSILKEMPSIKLT